MGAKQVAQQEAERARFVVDKATQEKRSTIIRAQGEAQSAKLIGDAVRDNPGFLQLRRLEAAREIAGTLSKSSNRLFLDANSLLLNVADNASAVDLRSRNVPAEVMLPADALIEAPMAVETEVAVMA